MKNKFILVRNLNYKDLIIFIIPFLIFSYYLYVFNPGILTYDSYQQLHQIATNDFTNWHPFFHTFIEMLFINVFGNPVSIGLFQIIVFSIIWMIICKYNRFGDDLKYNKLFILQVIITLIISLIPINALYSITLWKDILFSYCLLFLCFLIKVMLDKKCNVDFKFMLIISLTMSFVWQLRPNGMFICLIFLIVSGIYFIKNNKNKKSFMIILSLTILFVFLISSLNMMYDVEDNQKDVLFDKTVHMLSFYDLNINMDHSDKQKIYEMITQKDINENFNIYFTDTTYQHSNKSVYDNNKKEFIFMTIKYSFKNPLNFMEYFLKSSAIVWDITRENSWSPSHLYNTDIEGSKSSFYATTNSSSKTNYDNVSAEKLGTKEYDNLNYIVKYSKDNKILNDILNSPALYMYLSFVILGLIYLITNSKHIFYVYLPNMINILSILLSTPIQDNRYLYANLLVFYFLIIVLIGIKYKNNLKLT